MEFLAASVRHLHALYPTFAHYYLSDETVPKTSEDDTIDLAQLICPILDFISAVTRHGKSKEWLESSLEELVSAIFNYAQITHEDVRNFVFSMPFPLKEVHRKRRGQTMQMRS